MIPAIFSLSWLFTVDTLTFYYLSLQHKYLSQLSPIVQQPQMHKNLEILCML